MFSISYSGLRRLTPSCGLGLPHGNWLSSVLILRHPSSFFFAKGGAFRQSPLTEIQPPQIRLQPPQTTIQSPQMVVQPPQMTPPTATKSTPATANPNVFNECVDALGRKKEFAVSFAFLANGRGPLSIVASQILIVANNNSTVANQISIVANNNSTVANGHRTVANDPSMVAKST